MSQERWDVVLRFLDGPLSYQGEMKLQGPVVRMGANPGPGGLKLDGYRSLDDRQAVITCYDGGAVAIAPVGANQVRVAPHEHVDWNEIQAIRGPVYLTDGTAFHLGPPVRGVSVVFVEAERLGLWEKRQILSDAAQAYPDLEPSEVKELDTQRGVPAWFIPACIVLFMTTAIVVLLPNLENWFGDKKPPLGPVVEGRSYYVDIPREIILDTVLMEGINQPFHDFVMAINASAAGRPALATNEKRWDTSFLEYVTKSMTAHGRARAFWRRLEEVHEDYAYVVGELRRARLPEVLAAIPYRESTYKPRVQSYVCARGWWQLMPETAKRANVEVRDCRFGSAGKTRWTPQQLAPPPGVYRNAPYTNGRNCRITRCDVDDREDLAASTRGASFLLKEAYEDREFQESGALVQLTILTHVAGYDDNRFREGTKGPGNILGKYRRYLRENKLEYAVDFYGQNIKCGELKQEDHSSISARCGSYLWNHTQQYAYAVVAQHFLAVCYYAKNHGQMAAFDPWRKYTFGKGYCTGIDTPTEAELRGKGSL